MTGSPALLSDPCPAPVAAAPLRMVDLCRALADTTRLRIVALLGRMELSVGEIALVLDQSQPRVSRHIRILADAGLVDRRREGSWVFLALPDGAMSEAVSALMAVAGDEDNAILLQDVARLDAVRAERARAAEDYFRAHAEQWDAIRSLHVPETEVEHRMVAMLPEWLGHLADVGTGTGRMLELFADRADRLIGIDRSPEMLRLARAKLEPATPRQSRPGHPVSPPCELRQGDVLALPLPDDAVDTAILHQVLHFIPTPERALVEISRIVRPGGRALIVDFGSHDREDLRSCDAHARLGFSDAQIATWGGAAGLALEQTDSLAGDPLTVNLWLLSKPAAQTQGV